jgi:hypothetical protein
MGKDGHLAVHPRGYPLYEDTCFYGVWDDPGRFISIWKAHRRETPFGLKNTYLGLHLDWIVPLIKQVGDVPRAIMVHRTAMDSIRGRVAGKCPPAEPPDKATFWWLRAMRMHADNLLKTTIPVAHVGYEDLMADPEQSVHDIARFVFDGFAQKPTDEQIEDAINHVGVR